MRNISYQLSWLKTVEFAGSYIAEERGYFTNNKLGVTLLAGGPNVQVVPLITNGKALIGQTGLDQAAEAVNQGAPIKIVAMLYQRNPFCVVSRTDKVPIKTPADLLGKKIGVAAGNSTSWNAFLKLNKLDVSKINVLPAQFDPTPVATGEFEGQVVFATNEVIQLQLKGFQTQVLMFEDFNYHLATDAYIVRTDTLANKTDRQTVVDFMRAELKGWQDGIADPATAANLTVTKYGKDTGLTYEQQLGEMKAQIPLIVNDYTKAHGLAYFDGPSLAPSFATLAASGITAPQSMLDTSILPEIYQGKTTL
jgi:ABC-type nitrate/sulfonate/bicarbonate transport system substrate-binding protein